MQPIKVLFVYHTANRGGVDEYLYTVLKHIDHEKFTCSILLPQAGVVAERYTQLGIPVINLDLSTKGYRAQDVLKVYQVVKHFDVIYGNSFCKSTRTVGIAAKLARKPFIWHVYEVLNASHASPARLLKFADRVVAVSQTSRDSLLPFANGGIPVIYNPFDTRFFQCTTEQHAAARSALMQEYSLPENAFICLTIGRVSEDKGIDLLMQIAQRLAERFPQVFFFVVGEWGSLQEQIRRQQHALGLNDKIFFTGFQDDLFPYLHGSDLLLHPSRYESFGRVIAEGLLCGLPAVAFNIGGISEVLEDGKSGYLISPFDTDNFVEKVVILLDNEKLRHTFGLHGRTQIENNFSIREIVNKIEDVLVNVSSC